MGMTSNPLFLAQMQSGSSSGQLSAKYTEDALSSPIPPDAAVWGLVRESLVMMRDKVQSLQQQNAMLQDELVNERSAPRGNNLAAGGLGIRMKRAEFEPVLGGGAGLVGNAQLSGKGALGFRSSAATGGSRMVSMRALSSKPSVKQQQQQPQQPVVAVETTDGVEFAIGNPIVKVEEQEKPKKEEAAAV